MRFCPFYSSANLSLPQQPDATPRSTPEQEVTQVEHDWLTADAKGDAASLRRIIADDFMGSSFDGGLLSKQDVIPQGGRPGGFAGATASETSVRVFGGTGVLMGVINTAGDPQPKQIRVTLVCQKRAQDWADDCGAPDALTSISCCVLIAVARNDRLIARQLFEPKMGV